MKIFRNLWNLCTSLPSMCKFLQLKIHKKLRHFWDRQLRLVRQSKEKPSFLLQVCRLKEIDNIHCLPESWNMSAASSTMQNTLKGSQLNKRGKNTILHFVRPNLRQKVADLVKRIRFVLRTCRELLADLWNQLLSIMLTFRKTFIFVFLSAK